MEAVRLHEHGGPDVLQVEEVERPTPAQESLLVEIAAAGINPVDTYFRDGSYSPVGLPFTPGVDFAGVVAETGGSVTDFAPGDRVFGVGIGNGSHQGAYAEFATVPVDRVVHVPDGVSLTEIGCIGVAGVTAWRSLISIAELAPTEYCLVHGGSGGVGHAAVQVGAAAGARVVTTASPAYHDDLRNLGAVATLDYSREDLAGAVIDAADGGVDVILDHRLDDYLQFDADVAADGASVVGVGENQSDPGFTDDGVARSKDVTYHFISIFNAPDLRVPLRGIADLMAMSEFSTSVAHTYDLDEAPEAQRAVLEDSYLGKLAITP